MLLIGIITGLIILVFLVVIHELGHGIVARRNGVVVEEFGVGFPPKAIGKRIKHSILGKNVLFSLNWLPLGGFVRLKGEHDSADQEGDYGAASYWVKTKILLAGVLMNWLAAAVIFTILAVVGMPKILPNQFSIPGSTRTVSSELQVAQIETNSPAEKAGLKVGDKLLRVNNHKIEASEKLAQKTEQLHGTTIGITYLRDGQERTARAELRADNDDKKGYLGVATTQREELYATWWTAPVVGVGTTAQLTGETFASLGKLVVSLGEGIGSKFSSDPAAQKSGNEALSEAGNSVSGPLGILGVIFPAMQQAGIKPLLLLSGVISLSLAVMNVLPIPALDGGRWFTMTLFKIIRKPLTKDIEEQIQATGFLLLMGLVVLVTVADVGKFFR